MVMRRGFGLVEVVVAVTLVGIGIISIAAGAAFSTRLLRTAENEEDASRTAEVLIDSLASSGASGDGAVDVGRFHASWTSAGSDMTVKVSSRESDAAEIISLVIIAAPRLDSLPCRTCNE